MSEDKRKYHVVESYPRVRNGQRETVRRHIRPMPCRTVKPQRKR